MKITKQDIYQLPVEHWHDLDEPLFEQTVKASNIKAYSSWLLPQLVAHFGRWKIYAGEKQTITKNISSNLDKVFYRLVRLRRSILISGQTRTPEYGQLTPIILLAFRRHQGVPYSHWQDNPDLNWLLEPDLHRALILEGLPAKLSQERLLAIRQQGLMAKTGKNAGELKSAESTWKLTGIQDTELGAYDPLLQTMLCQTWLAHPKHRRETMILDPYNWDQQPQPLVSNDLFESTPQPAKPKPKLSLPWLED